MSSSTTAADSNLTSISPFFILQDLRASISHYIERFGFTLDFQGPADDVYYAHVSRDGIGIMLKAVGPDVDDGLRGFEVTDADGYVLAFFRLRR
jgi:hypothetical protein